ncbi:hypothetical protein D3C80_1753540 [compost metagenome]
MSNMFSHLDVKRESIDLSVWLFEWLKNSIWISARIVHCNIMKFVWCIEIYRQPMGNQVDQSKNRGKELMPERRLVSEEVDLTNLNE